MGKIALNVRVIGNGYVVFYHADINGSNILEPIFTLDGNGSATTVEFPSTPVQWYEKNRYRIIAYSHDPVNNPFVKFCSSPDQSNCTEYVYGYIDYYDYSYQEWIAYFAPVPDPVTVVNTPVILVTHGNGEALVHKNGMFLGRVVSNMIIPGTFPTPWIYSGFNPWFRTGDILEIVPASFDPANPFEKFCSTYYQTDCITSSIFKTIAESSTIECHLYFLPVEPAPMDLDTKYIMMNIRNTFLKGSSINLNSGYSIGGSCDLPDPGISYVLASTTGYSHWNRWTNSCDGVILLNDKGYQQIHIRLDIWNKYAQGQSITFYIYESSDDISYSLIFTKIYKSSQDSSPEHLIEDILVPIKGKYIKLKGYMPPSSGEGTLVGSVTASQLQLFKKISAYVHTPEAYPVYNALITFTDADDQSVLFTSITDEKGLTQKTEVDIVAHRNIKIWGEKTIDKPILRKTAKEISEIININADEEPNDNIP